MVSAALITPGGDPVSLCILTIPLYILYELAIITGSIIEIRKKKREWLEWDESIQGPRPEKPSAREKGIWIIYLSIFTMIGIISAFAYSNRTFIEPWIESFRQIGKFSKQEKEQDPKTHPANSFNVSPSNTTQSVFNQKEFIIQLSPIDMNSSAENNQSLFYRARILERD
jgi:cytoskeletal protein RodZ